MFQGNLDPCGLYAPSEDIDARVKMMVQQFGRERKFFQILRIYCERWWWRCSVWCFFFFFFFYLKKKKLGVDPKILEIELLTTTNTSNGTSPFIDVFFVFFFHLNIKGGEEESSTLKEYKRKTFFYYVKLKEWFE